MEENSKKGIIITLVIVIIILLLACGYLAYDKFIKGNNTQKIDETKEIALDLNDKDLAELYKIWATDIKNNLYTAEIKRYGETKEIDDEFKILMAISRLEYEKISCSNVKDLIIVTDEDNLICGHPTGFNFSENHFESIPITYANGMQGYNYKLIENDEVKNIIKSSDGYGYKMSDVDNEIKKIFGDSPYSKVDVRDASHAPYHYDSSVDAYLGYTCACSGGCSCFDPLIYPIYEPSLVKATKKGNIINMDVKFTQKDDVHEIESIEEYNFTFEYCTSTGTYGLKTLTKIK